MQQPNKCEEAEIAVAKLKWWGGGGGGRSLGVDNIPAELVDAGGETMTDVSKEICYKI